MTFAGSCRRSLEGPFVDGAWSRGRCYSGKKGGNIKSRSRNGANGSAYGCFYFILTITSHVVASNILSDFLVV